MSPARRPTTAPTSIHQLKVTLKGSRPPIWRRIQVRSDVTLNQLHHILQETMGWYDYHLHDFTVGDETFTDPESAHELGQTSERGVRLNWIAPTEKIRITYRYDFGDDWRHELLIEKVLPPVAETAYPICLAGKRACPPEDCGGIYGYAYFLDAIRDPKHEGHKTMTEWIGGSFDPEEFEVEAVNKRLARFR